MSELPNRVFRHIACIVVKKGDAFAAALVSTKRLERLEKRGAEREEGFEILDDIGAAFKGGPPEEIEREVAKALAEVRAEARVERETARQSR